MTDHDDPQDPQDNRPAAGASKPVDVGREVPWGPEAPAGHGGWHGLRPGARPGSGRGGRRTAVVLTAAALAAAGGGAIALAAGHSSTTVGSPSGSEEGPGGGGFSGGKSGGGGYSGGGPESAGHGRAGFGPRGLGGLGGLAGLPGSGLSGTDGAIHGTFTVGTGTYGTDVAQRGTVTAIGGGSLSVRSVDGYAKTYVLPTTAHTLGTARTGDTVAVVASVSGPAAATVTLLIDPQRITRPTTAPTARPSSPPSTPPNSGPSTPGTAPDTAPGTAPGKHGSGPGFAGMRGGFPRPLHGTFVVATGSGAAATYVTDTFQSGAVTAVSATSISLRSADGFTGTYAINAATKKIGTAATGDQVAVVATDSTATAVLATPSGGFPGGPVGRGPADGTAPTGGPSRTTT